MTASRTDVVEVDGAVLEYDVAGEGPAVVFLHPGLWDRRAWDEQFEVFAERHRVLRYDLRGFGRSSRLEAGVAYSHVEDLVAVMDAAGVDRAALVGCSMGGRIAIDAALTHPARAWALVPVAAGVGGLQEGTPEEEAWEAERLAPVEAAADAGDLDRAMTIEVRTMWALLGTDDARGRRILDIAIDNAHLQALGSSDERRIEPPAIGRLGEIALPTLVVVPDHDPPWTERVCRLIADGIAGARVVEIPDTDHVVNMRRPDAFNRVVLEFLADAGA